MYVFILLFAITKDQNETDRPCHRLLPFSPFPAKYEACGPKNN